MLQHEAPAALPFSKADESLRYERGGESVDGGAFYALAVGSTDPL